MTRRIRAFRDVCMVSCTCQRCHRQMSPMLRPLLGACMSERLVLRRLAAGVIVTVALAGLALAASPDGQAAATAHSARASAVVSGNARFEVLSPTLVRTEFAADGRFTDAS